MADWNFADIFERIASLVPDREAVVDGDRTFTWAEFDGRASAIATELTRLGLGHQAKVAVQLRNCAEFLETYYAILKAGLVPVNVNYRYGEDELAYLLDNAEAEVVVVGAEFTPTIAKIAARLPGVQRWLVVGDPDPALADLTAAGKVGRYDDAVDPSHASPRDWAAGRSGEDLMLTYTGGTTGMPKGVMWCQNDMFDGLIGASRQAFNLPPITDLDSLAASLVDTPGPRGLSASPFMHGTGLMQQLVMLLSGGTCVVLGGRRFEAARLWDTVAAHRVTAVVIVGDAFARPLIDALDATPDAWDLSSLEVVSSSGAIWTQGTKAELLRRLPHISLFDSLASTEGFGLARSVTTADTVADAATFTIGPYVRVLADDGTWMQPGDAGVGRLVVTGPLPRGYYRDEAKTAETFQIIDGQRYSMPGDYVELLADSSIHFVGRGNACINTGGEKVYAEEVEQVVKAHPSIVDAGVVGVPDDRFGSIVCAVVVLRPDHSLTREELATHVKQKLADFKAPRRMIVTETIPRTITGKLDYPSLRQLVDDASAAITTKA